MKRFLPALLAVVALASCSGKANSPATGGGDNVGPAEPADADLEAECQAAAGKLASLEVTYEADGVTSAVIHLAWEKSGRTSIIIDGGDALIFDGTTLITRNPVGAGQFEVTRVPIGFLWASALAIVEGRPLPDRDTVQPIPPGHVFPNLALLPDERGHAVRNASIGIGLAEVRTFGWLDILHPRPGYNCSAPGRAAIVSGAAGKISIDRDTGALLEWIVVPPNGKAARIKAGEVRRNEPVDPSAFRIEGPAAPERRARDLVAQYVAGLAAEVLRADKDPGHRVEKCLKFVRVYYRAAWSSGEIARLAALGANRRAEKTKEMRQKYPDFSEEDIAKATSNIPRLTIDEDIHDDLKEEVLLFRAIAGIAQGSEAPPEFNEGYGSIVDEELFGPAIGQPGKK